MNNRIFELIAFACVILAAVNWLQIFRAQRGKLGDMAPLIENLLRSSPQRTQ